MSVEFDRGSPGKFDSRTLNRKTLNRWTVRNDDDNDNHNGKKGYAPEVAKIAPYVVYDGFKMLRNNLLAQMWN